MNSSSVVVSLFHDEDLFEELGGPLAGLGGEVAFDGLLELAHLLQLVADLLGGSVLGAAGVALFEEGGVGLLAFELVLLEVLALCELLQRGVVVAKAALLDLRQLDLLLLEVHQGHLTLLGLFLLEGPHLVVLLQVHVLHEVVSLPLLLCLLAPLLPLPQTLQLVTLSLQVVSHQPSPVPLVGVFK